MNDLDPASKAQLFDDVYRGHVQMVLYARKGAGTWSDEDELTSFTIYLGERTIVRINDEDYGWLPAHSTRDFAEGETIEFDEVVSEQVALPEELRPPYVTASATKTGWEVQFDFRRSDPRTRVLLETGDEFRAVAQAALEAGHLRAFIENAFHAAESYAKAELMAYPIVSDEVSASNRHGGIQSAYDLWARLENTEARFPALLRQLFRMRSAATYAEGDFAPADEQVSEWEQTLRDQATSAHSASISGRSKIHVIATRAIQAGRLVGPTDATIRPPKKRPAR